MLPGLILGNSSWSGKGFAPNGQFGGLGGEKRVLNGNDHPVQNQ